MTTKKAPTKTTPKKKAAAANEKAPQPITVAPTPSTEKALKKMSKRMTKFVTDPNNNKEQVELYFAEIIEFIEASKEAGSKPPQALKK